MRTTRPHSRALAVLFVAFALLGLVTLGGACSSSADAPTSPPPPGPEGGALDAEAREADAPAVTPFTEAEAEMRAAATAFNEKFCKAYQTCDPVLFKFAYRDAAECMAAGGNMMKATWVNGQSERYAAQLDAPYGYGSVLTPHSLVGCASAFSDSDCDAFFRFQNDDVVPPACAATLQGSLPNGSPCRYWNQCASGRCVSPTPASCGTCIATQPAGGPCPKSYFACESGTVCDNFQSATATCKKLGEVGDACEVSSPICHSYLICKDGKCARAAADGSCTDSSDCPQHFVVCGVDSKCTPTVLGGVGDPCFDGVHTGCERDLSCALGPVVTPDDAGSDDAGSDDAATPSIEARCRPLVPDGLSCSPALSFDYPCETADSHCLNNKCQQNGPAQCSQPAAAP